MSVLVVDRVNVFKFLFTTVGIVYWKFEFHEQGDPFVESMSSQTPDPNTVLQTPRFNIWVILLIDSRILHIGPSQVHSSDCCERNFINISSEPDAC